MKNAKLLTALLVVLVLVSSFQDASGQESRPNCGRIQKREINNKEVPGLIMRRIVRAAKDEQAAACADLE